jgi:hypothetical protein
MLNTQFRGKDMDIYVLTKDDNLYASSCSPNGKPLTLQEVLTLWNERSKEMTLNGSHYDVMYADMGSLRVVTLFQRSLLEEALYRWRIMLGLVCVGFIALSVVLFLLMDRWFYSPMKNLLVSYGMVPEKNSEQNEYMQISHAMEQMSANIAFLEQRMRDEEQRALEQTPGLFLDSESPAGQTQYYAVFTLVFENGKGVYQHDRCRQLCMMVEKECPLAVIYDHNAIFACVIGLNEKRTPDAMLAGMLEALQESGDYVRIGISDVHEASEELSVAFDYMKRNHLCNIDYSEQKADMGYTTRLYYYDVPFVFNAPYGGFTDYLDMIHEFGHFSNMFYTQTDLLFGISDIDLGELQSQGLEILFTAFYDDIFGAYADDVEEYLLMDIVCAIIEGAM